MLTEGTTPAATLARTTVRDVMQLGLFECPPDADLTTLASTMAEKRIHCVVIAGVERGDQRTWGIVSDLDLMRGLCPGPDAATAGELAATDVVAVAPDDTLEHAAQLMAEHDTAHLVVTSPDTGRPVGMVSTLDVACAVAAGYDVDASSLRSARRTSSSEARGRLPIGRRGGSWAAR